MDDGWLMSLGWLIRLNGDKDVPDDPADYQGRLGEPLLTIAGTIAVEEWEAVNAVAFGGIMSPSVLHTALVFANSGKPSRFSSIGPSLRPALATAWRTSGRYGGGCCDDLLEHGHTRTLHRAGVES